MADKGKKYTIGKIVAPVANPQTKGNTLYVTDPNARELQMYKDSVAATGYAKSANEGIEKMNKMPMDKRRQAAVKGVIRPKESKEAITRLQIANNKRYDTATPDKSISTELEAPKGLGYLGKGQGFGLAKEVPGVTNKTKKMEGTAVYNPKRKVVLVKPEEPKPEKPKPKPVGPSRPKPDPVEKMEIRPADTQIVKPKEEKEREVSPVKEPLKRKRGGVGDILRKPDQSLLGKIKRRFNGEPNERYWVDKDGVKRFPISRGENRPETVQEIKLAKGNLNPKVREDKIQLDRIDEYFKNKASQKEE